MIQDYSKLTVQLTQWLKNYVQNAGLKSLVVPLNESIDSFACALLCQQSGIPTNITVNLDDFIFKDEIKDISTKLSLEISYFSNDGNYYLISEAAKSKKGIIVASTNKQDWFLGNFKKHMPIDILPFINFSKKEIKSLFLFFTKDKEISYINRDYKGLTYDEMEWGISEDKRTSYHTPGSPAKCGILAASFSPVEWEHFHSYTGRQQQIIAKMHQLHHMSEHKRNYSLPRFNQ